MMDFYEADEILAHLDGADMGRYYTRCLLPMKERKTGKVYIVYIDKMEKRKSLAAINGALITINNRDWLWPMGFNWTGYLNMDKFAVYAARTAKRQWRKGLNRNNTEVWVRFQETLEAYYVGYRDLAVLRQDITALAKPLQALIDKGIKGYYPAYDVAYNKLLKGEVGSVAVSPEFALGVDEIADTPYLLKSNIIVGRAYSDHVLLDADHRQLWPQINFTEARGV